MNICLCIRFSGIIHKLSFIIIRKAWVVIQHNPILSGLVKMHNSPDLAPSLASELRDALVRLPLRNSAIRRRLNSDGGLKLYAESGLIQYPPPIEKEDSPSELKNSLRHNLRFYKMEI